MLDQYEDKGWNDAFIPDEMSLNYENLDIEQLLGIMERKVNTLMKDVILLMGRSESVFRMTTNKMYRPPSEPSCQEEFKHIYKNVEKLRRDKAINSFDGDDLAFPCMIGFRKSVAYFDPFLLMNIITRKAYNTIMVEGLESTGKNLVAVVRDVYVFIGSFTYIRDFVVLEDIGEFIQINKVEVVMGKPFRKITKLRYDCAKGLMSFNRIFDNYTFQLPRTIPRFKHWGHVSWSKISPILVLNQRDLTNGFKNAYEKNKFMYKNCLNLGPEYQVDESMKEWLIHGHVSIHEVT
ncbi:hypothetical protein Tco_0087181 [Tanacetum coccineum]